jgi:hypothetical protein
MTSWIQAPPRKKVVEKSYFFQTNDSGFCSNFNQFLYAYVYTQSLSRTLEVYDMANAVSINFPLINNTFGDISGVVYKDSMSANATNLRRDNFTLRSYLERMENASKTSAESLRAVAQRIFQWNPSLITTIQEILSSANLPGEFDLGVHIRVGDKITTGEAKPIALDNYIRAVKSFQASSKKDTLAIFLMSDSLNVISEFKKKSDSSWKIYTLPPALPNPDGHVQNQFNISPSRVRLAAYNTFMAELLVMQSISNIVCTLSSNVGRFLYYTVEHAENILSLDEKFSIK